MMAAKINKKTSYSKSQSDTSPLSSLLKYKINKLKHNNLEENINSSNSKTYKPTKIITDLDEEYILLTPKEEEKLLSELNNLNASSSSTKMVTDLDDDLDMCSFKEDENVSDTYSLNEDPSPIYYYKEKDDSVIPKIKSKLNYSCSIVKNHLKVESIDCKMNYISEKPSSERSYSLPQNVLYENIYPTDQLNSLRNSDCDLNNIYQNIYSPVNSVLNTKDNIETIKNNIIKSTNLLTDEKNISKDANEKIYNKTTFQEGKEDTNEIKNTRKKKSKFVNWIVKTFECILGN